MKLLAIDKGNSKTKVGLEHENGEMGISIFENNAENELLDFIKKTTFDAAVMSSVATGNLASISDYLKSNGKFLFLDSSIPIPLKNEYATPETLGADRIAGAIGAWKLTGEKDVLLMDAGTCINYECVINGAYKGGAIAPGLQMRLKAMHEYTGKLPLMDLPETKIELTGNSTAGCIISGAVLGMVFEMHGIAETYKVQYPGISVVLSGGDAPYLGMYLKNSIFTLHKEVVLKGLIEILKYNVHV